MLNFLAPSALSGAQRKNAKTLKKYTFLFQASGNSGPKSISPDKASEWELGNFGAIYISKFSIIVELTFANSISEWIVSNESGKELQKSKQGKNYHQVHVYSQGGRRSWVVVDDILEPGVLGREDEPALVDLDEAAEDDHLGAWDAQAVRHLLESDTM